MKRRRDSEDDMANEIKWVHVVTTALKELVLSQNYIAVVKTVAQYAWAEIHVVLWLSAVFLSDSFL